jgi:hypothetical protein
MELREKKGREPVLPTACLECGFDGSKIGLIEKEATATAVDAIVRSLKVLTLRIEGCLLDKPSLRCPASILGRARDAILRELSSLLREWEGSHPLQPRTLSILLRASLPDVSRLASPFRVSLLDAFPFPFEMFAFVP